MAVARAAARFLVQKQSTRVLDIGSGAGKFCLIGAALTNGHFTGVEQRTHLHTLSQKLRAHYQLSGVEFICSNITRIDFRNFDAFYFFNAFFENIQQDDRLDALLPLDRTLYDRYSSYVYQQLDTLPAGTRLATFYSYQDEIPDSYMALSADFGGKLIFWEKC